MKITCSNTLLYDGIQQSDLTLFSATYARMNPFRVIMPLDAHRFFNDAFAAYIQCHEILRCSIQGENGEGVLLKAALKEVRSHLCILAKNSPDAALIIHEHPSPSHAFSSLDIITVTTPMLLENSIEWLNELGGIPQ
jgi:hypothetical protein